MLDAGEGGGQLGLEVGDVVFFVVEGDDDGNHARTGGFIGGRMQHPVGDGRTGGYNCMFKRRSSSGGGE